MNMREILDLRARKIAEAETLAQKALGENRNFTEDEDKAYKALRQEINDLASRAALTEEVGGWKASLDKSTVVAGRGLAAADLGLNDKEKRQYSILRAVEACAFRDWNKAPFELELSQAVAKRLGREPQGFFVPRDITKRALSVGGEGADLVATELRIGSMIDMLRNRLVLRQAGARYIGDLVGDIDIPRQTGGVTGYWLTETGQATDSDITIDQVNMTPHILGAYTEITRKMTKQTSLDAESFLQSDLAIALQTMLDQAGLHGTGASNQPTGIANTSGVAVVAGGTNGAAPTWDHAVDLETEVFADNADVATMAYVTNAKVRGKYKKTEVVSGTGIFVWQDGDTPLNGYRALVSNQVRSDLAKGTGANLSANFFGNWSDLIVALWGEMDLLADVVDLKSGKIGLSAFLDADIAVRHAESFSVMLDAITA